MPNIAAKIKEYPKKIIMVFIGEEMAGLLFVIIKKIKPNKIA